MLVFLQIVTILGMLVMTYLVFIAFGNPRIKLLFTKQEKEEWDEEIGQSIGSWFTKTNIIGSLTSLATVYVFFVGSSKLFGFWIFICSLTIWFGAYITNFFTRKICDDKYVSELLNSPNQTGGVISCLFWRPNDRGAIATAVIIKWISMINIVSVVWFEFSLFTEISSRLIGVTEIPAKILFLVVCCFGIVFFTLRYGLRGFVFADFFQTPLIAIGSSILLVGTIVLAYNSSNTKEIFSDLLSPLLSTKDCILFVIQVISLNLLLVLVTESHWLRVWIFGSKETKLQASSTFYTAILWGGLAVIGLMAYGLVNNSTSLEPVIGIEAVASLIQKLSELSYIFLVAFWIGGMAALFSTADAQIYSFLVVNQFHASTGKLKETVMGNIKPFRLATLVTLFFAVIFYIIQYFPFPYEKVIFIAIPLCLNIFPAFVLAVLNRKQQPIYIILSIILYTACSCLGFNQSSSQFSWTLLAPFCPVIVSVFIYFTSFFQQEKA